AHFLAHFRCNLLRGNAATGVRIPLGTLSFGPRMTVEGGATMDTKTTSDVEALKERLRSTWAAGDFGIVARLVEEANEEIVARLDIKPGTQALDVACGTGNSAIPAAKRGADVTGVDIAANLIEQAKARA